MKRKSFLIDLVVSSITYLVFHKTFEHFDKKKHSSNN